MYIGIVRNISTCESACKVLQYFAQKLYISYLVMFIGYILPLISIGLTTCTQRVPIFYDSDDDLEE